MQRLLCARAAAGEGDEQGAARDAGDAAREHRQRCAPLPVAARGLHDAGQLSVEAWADGVDGHGLSADAGAADGEDELCACGERGVDGATEGVGVRGVNGAVGEGEAGLRVDPGGRDVAGAVGLPPAATTSLATRTATRAAGSSVKAWSLLPPVLGRVRCRRCGATRWLRRS